MTAATATAADEHPLVALGASDPHRSSDSTTAAVLDWRQVFGGALILLGLMVLGLGWLGVAREDEVFRQIPYVISGGLMGTALTAIGALVLIGYDHHRDRQVLTQVIERLDELEFALGTEFDELRDALATKSPSSSRR